MSTSRLAILAAVAVGLALVAATQTCRDRASVDDAARSDASAAAKADPPAGVSPRAGDSAIDLRDRDRLRDDEAPPPAGVPPTPEAAAEPTPPREDPQEGAEPPTVVGPPASPTVEAAMSAAKAAAQDEIAKVRTAMRRTCWDGLDRGGKGEGGVQLAFSLSFDAQGHVVASAVQQQSREDYITGLDTCLAPFAHAIEVPAPGEPVSVDVELALP